MITPEGRVKQNIRKFLRTVPRCWHFMPMQNGMGVVGIPDLLCTIGGRFVAIECKAPGKERNVTPNQQQVIAGITEAGGLAFVASDVETVRARLQEEGMYAGDN